MFIVMKLIITAFLTLIFFYASAQNYEECTKKGLPRIKATVSLKGSTVGDTIFIEQNKLKEGIELELSPSIGRIIGYYVVSGCEGCDIITVPVCGSKMEDKFFQRLKGFRNGDWLQFYRINIEINGNRYLAHEFMVYIKE
jgi:hypothetical protein